MSNPTSQASALQVAQQAIVYLLKWVIELLTRKSEP